MLLLDLKWPTAVEGGSELISRKEFDFWIFFKEFGFRSIGSAGD